MDERRVLLRHTLATLAYRGAKPLRESPADFAATRACPTCRSAGEILAHIGDLLDWALTAVRGDMKWVEKPLQAWDVDVARFFAALQKLDDYLASDQPLVCPAEKLFQGPIADAFTHVGQLATLRRLAGAPVRGENYYAADIAAGRVGAEQAPPEWSSTSGTLAMVAGSNCCSVRAGTFLTFAAQLLRARCVGSSATIRSSRQGGRSMNSLRPLITITILGLVGAWLYVQINKGPARPTEGEAPAWAGPTDEGVPPIATTSPAMVPAPQVDAGSAPKWPDSASAAPPVSPASQSAAATLEPAPTASNSNGLTEMPAIPELPDVPRQSPAAPPATAANGAPVDLPANIPQARYPDASGAPSTGAAAPTTQSQIPPANSTSPDATAVGSAPAAASQTAPPLIDDHENSIATDKAMAAAGFAPQQPPAVTAPVDANPPTAQSPAASADRYGIGATNPNTPISPATAMPPVEPTFAAAWPEIQAALDRGELARAHQMLTKWYADDSLSAAEAQKLDAILGQLAGTVVYSTEHQLEPAYVVRPGQTLESIANDFNVPWQLLAKINGIPAANAVQPGQKLKVVRGPFSAVVDLRRRQLALFVDGRYAGKFPITVPAGAVVSEGKWMVDQKLAAPAASVTQAAYTPASAAADRMIVLRGEDPSTGKPAAAGPTLAIASSSPGSVPTAGAPAIRISPQDAEELSDILSIGSRVTIRK